MGKLNTPMKALLILTGLLSTLSLRAQELPLPWKHRDMGAAQVSDAAKAPAPGEKAQGRATVAGTAEQAAGVFTLQGTMDIWGANDGCHIVWQPLHGDGELAARVVDLKDPGKVRSDAKACLCIRESLDAGSRGVTLGVQASGSVRLTCRDTANGMTALVFRGDKTVEPNSPFPRWLKIVRLGNEFSGYESQDNQKWKPAGHIKLDLAADTLIGLATGSHKPDTLIKATFDHVKVSTPLAAGDGLKRAAVGEPNNQGSDLATRGTEP